MHFLEEDINLNSRLFLWPSELEKVLDLSGARLAVVRENLEQTLKERRANFEQYLIAEKKKMDSFRLKAKLNLFWISAQKDEKFLEFEKGRGTLTSSREIL